jgi:hypothetical protein
MSSIGRLVRRGYEASTAARFATSEALAYGQLTQTELESCYPGTHWLTATGISTPSHDGVLKVSTSVNGGQIVTPVAETGGLCAWGLAGKSSSEPMTTSDEVSGRGVYWTATTPQTTTNPRCEASAARSAGRSTLSGRTEFASACFGTSRAWIL